MIRELSRDDWGQWLRSLAQPSGIYFTPEYFDTWTAIEDATPVALGVTIGERDFLYAFLKKPNGLDDFCDIFSPYGYGGILPSSAKPVAPKTLEKLNNELNDWCSSAKVVAEFIRDDPSLVPPLRTINRSIVRTNVFTDLEKPLDQSLHPRAKRNLRIATRHDLAVHCSNDESLIPVFIKLYYQTMKKLSADSFYFFDRDYFERNLRLLKDNAEFIFVMHKDRAIASALCYRSGINYVFHLGASDAEHLNKRPNDFLYNAMIERGHQLGFKRLQMGGGISNSPDDSLFEFKKHYGTLLLPCTISHMVHQPEVYSSLCEEWAKKHPNLQSRYAKYVLKYHYGGAEG